MPTSQSARLRPRAASARIVFGRRSQVSKPSRIASGVSDEIHNRLTGFSHCGGFVDVAKNQLAFAPCVRGADDAGDPG